jgi:hypothetical protein
MAKAAVINVPKSIVEPQKFQQNSKKLLTRFPVPDYKDRETGEPRTPSKKNPKVGPKIS